MNFPNNENTDVSMLPENLSQRNKGYMKTCVVVNPDLAHRRREDAVGLAPKAEKKYVFKL